MATSTATNFGSDLSCVTDLTPAMAETSGQHIVAEAVARRWQTPRGGLIDDPSYGYDLTDFVDDDISQQDIARLSAGAEAEALKDERVFACTVKTTFAGGLLIVVGTITTALGPFTLVLSVSAVSVQILRVSTQ